MGHGNERGTTCRGSAETVGRCSEWPTQTDPASQRFHQQCYEIGFSADGLTISLLVWRFYPGQFLANMISIILEDLLDTRGFFKINKSACQQISKENFV